MGAIKIVRALNTELDRWVKFGFCWPDEKLPPTPHQLLELIYFPEINFGQVAPSQRSQYVVEQIIAWDQEVKRYLPPLLRVLGREGVVRQAAVRKNLQEAYALDRKEDREKSVIKCMRNLPNLFPYLTEKAGNASIACLELLGKDTWLAPAPSDEHHAQIQQLMSHMGMEAAPLSLLWMLCGCHTCFKRLRSAVAAAVDLGKPNRDRGITNEDRAIVFLRHHQQWSRARICEEVGVTRGAYRHWKHFKMAYDLLRQKPDLPRGSKQDGRVEAVDSQEPWESLDSEPDEDEGRSA